MYLKLVSWFVVLFIRVESQRAWGPNGYNTGFSNSWTSNGFSNQNIGGWSSNPFGSNQFSSPYDVNTNQRPNEQPSYGLNNDKPNWNSNRPTGGFNTRKQDKEKYETINVSNDNDNSKTNEWNSNNNNDFFSSVSDDFSSFVSKPNNRKPTSNYNSNGFNNNNKPTGNDISNDDNSVYSWGTNNKEKNKPNKWKTTTSKPAKSTSTTSSWNQNENTNTQEESNKKTVDTSILDELDKNDWYFGKESNYPQPPFRSVLNIDVGELWNFDRNRKSNQNSKDRKNNRRRNRQTADGIQCECVSVNLCDEEDMIITQEDVVYGWRPLEAFRCAKLSEVCCTNPKTRLSSRANIDEEKSLYCGQKRFTKSFMEGTADGLVDLGELPWILQFQSSENNCSASLIHPLLALTAAHCVANVEASNLNLIGGIWNSNEEPPQFRKVSQIILHPAYSSQNPRNDIALLVLENGFTLNDNVNTICLPFANTKWNLDECIVAGWRLKKLDDKITPVLEKTTVEFIPQPECQNILLVTDLWRNYILHDSFVCAREKAGSHACLENEGGPIMCPNQKEPDTYLQIGIVSNGVNCDDFGRPGIFTNILKFLDWINKNHFDLGLNYDLDIRSF